MRVAHVTREQFLAYMGNTFTPEFQETELRDIPKSGLIGIVCDDILSSVIHLPQCVIIAQAERGDFLAWTGTYLPQLFPITRFIRILDEEEIQQLRTFRNQPLGDKPFYSLVAATIAELSIHQRSTRSLLVSRDLIRSTYSYTLGRALLLGYSLSALERASQRLEELRPRFEARTRVLSVMDVLEALSPLIQGPIKSVRAKTTKSMPSGVWHEILAEADKDDAHTFALIANELRLPGNMALQSLVSRDSTLEDRVRELEKLLMEIDSLSPKYSGSYPLIGYLLSRVDPGTLRHLDMFRGLHSVTPQSLLWYGVFAGNYSDIRLMDVFDGLGFKVAQEFAEEYTSPYARPECDIEAREFIGLPSTQRTRFFSELRPKFYASIEIAPAVESVFRIPSRDNSSMQADLFESSEARIDLEKIEGRIHSAKSALEEFLNELYRRRR